MIIASSLPEIILREFFNIESNIPTLLAIAGSTALLLVSLFYQRLKPLRLYFALSSVVALLHFVFFDKLKNSDFWENWFSSNPSDFLSHMMGNQILRLAVAFLVLGFCYLTIKSRKDFYLTRGNLKGEVKPVKGLGVKEGETWNQFGLLFGLYLSGGLLIFLLVAGGLPQISQLKALVPLLPAVVLLAASNAFFEEFVYRASFLSVLEKPIGGGQALWLTAAAFGIGHYYGVPYGIIGVFLSGFLGFLLGKSMQETKGFFWAFVIHLVMDILIFSSMAMGAVSHGGV